MPAFFQILLIDNEADTSVMVTRSAEQFFPEAVIKWHPSASSALACIEESTDANPRLILLDVNDQHESSRFDELRLIRAYHAGHPIPIVVLSYDLNRSVSRDAYSQGANAYTRKPESYADWKDYIRLLRSYWYETVTTSSDDLRPLSHPNEHI